MTSSTMKRMSGGRRPSSRFTNVLLSSFSTNFSMKEPGKRLATWRRFSSAWMEVAGMVQKMAMAVRTAKEVYSRIRRVYGEIWRRFQLTARGSATRETEHSVALIQTGAVAARVAVRLERKTTMAAAVSGAVWSSDCSAASIWDLSCCFRSVQYETSEQRKDGRLDGRRGGSEEEDEGVVVVVVVGGCFAGAGWG